MTLALRLHNNDSLAAMIAKFAGTIDIDAAVVRLNLETLDIRAAA